MKEIIHVEFQRLWSSNKERLHLNIVGSYVMRSRSLHVQGC